MRDEYRGTTNARTIGECVYCGAHGENVVLTDEHIVPYALGAGAYLKDASCEECATITQAFELHLARNIFGHHRIHKGVQTIRPKKRTLELSARVLVRGVEHRKNLSVANHPYFLTMPIWDGPGLLRGTQPSTEFPGLSAHMFYHIPANIRDALQLSDGEIAEIRPESHTDAVQFGRAIAKIAYCQAVAKFGLDGFDHIELPSLILGHYPNVSFFVGTVLADPPGPVRDGVDHRIDLGTSWIVDPRNGLSRRYFVATVRLFRQDGTAQHGMPVYTVITGAAL
jgi:hypothetical protein